MMPQLLFPCACFRDIVVLSLPRSPKIFPVKAKGTKALTPGGMTWVCWVHVQVHCFLA